ncbi:hypothetical protein V2W30_04160 [Streptomyces sp. Q6]|uniref:Uncharacterized protein n=1 Tax=Streptomyces citrinus TaxID=3118173 RepID=A0ACD5A615_9ACTN
MTGDKVGAGRLLSFTDALDLLGVDSARIAALDRALGGVLNVATGGVSGTVLGMVSERGRIVGLGRDALRNAGGRLGRTPRRADRTDVLRAAHTVIVLVAWFQALEEVVLPFSLDDVELTRSEQLRLAEGHDADFVASLLATGLPYPTPHTPPEEISAALRSRYEQYATRFIAFLQGLAMWEALPPYQQAAAHLELSRMTSAAQAKYQGLFSQLCVTAPEFAFWVTQAEHQSTRAAVRRALDGIDALLAATTRALDRPVDVADRLCRAHTAALDHPVLDASTTPEGVSVPSLGALYIDPDFRVAQPQGRAGPADETWWERHAVRGDLTRYLVGALTNPVLTEAPLLVLGQPGAGKSVLTRVLAARLPGAGFLPVRVPLREVRADSDLQDQIEQAIRIATGERTTWPDLVRAAGGSTPVLLLDSFDELLQTTGTHHQDYLTRVARFQRRESEQGRPVVVLVTSRTAVADRARFPEGTVALRLEPFRPEQVRTWLAIWNRTNASAARPLSWQTVARHTELATQPLLLTMLALYDATEGGLPREDAEPLAVTELYEQLLSSFARREVGKATRGAVPDDVTSDLVERELHRLSLVAFATVNRRRQWVSAGELDQDLTALPHRPAAGPTGTGALLKEGEIALGRFFFVHRARSQWREEDLATYEFLHATFGEYLAVRLAVRLLRDLAASNTPAPDDEADDDLAYALLSYASLASRQMLGFARELLGRMSDGERRRLAARLVQVLYRHRTRTGDEHAAYCPQPLPTSSRHGIYGSNLVLVIVALYDAATAADLFPDAADDAAADAWLRHCLLWRASMDEAQWTDFALSLETHHRWNEAGRRRLEIRLRTPGPPLVPDPLDANWLFGRGRGQDGCWQRTYWDELWHKSAVSGPTSDGITRHALDPVLANLGAALTTFVAVPGERATSLAHDALTLILADTTDLPRAELADRYTRVMRGIAELGPRYAHLDRLVDLLATARDRDRHRLPAEVRRPLDQLLREEMPLMARSSDDTVSADVRDRLRRVLDRHYPGLVDTARRRLS